MKHIKPINLQSLVEPEILDIGTYNLYRSGKNQKYDFNVSVDARPLATLIEAASHGHRLYELMSIKRPGDVFHYLWVSFAQVDQEVINYITVTIKNRPEYRFNIMELLEELPLLDFDSCFYWDDDDTLPFARTWLLHRRKSFWKERALFLLQVVTEIQGQIRQSNDLLIKHELGLLDSQLHTCDYEADVKRLCLLKPPEELSATLPETLAGKIQELIERPDVKSVSCFYGGFQLWRLLITEQVRRSIELNLEPQEAFELNGPDEGLGIPQVEHWGGFVHIPYEGMVPADLVFLPSWRVFRPEYASLNGSLAQASGLKCKYLFTPMERDFGELGCATREVIDGWVFYE